MDVQLKELLEKINKDGVETAEQKASEIIADAEKKASDIVAGAKKEAGKIIAEGKAEAARAEAGGKAAIAQAGRDLVLKTKNEIEVLFKSIVNTDTAAAMKGKTLEDAVITVVKAWADRGDYTVQLSESDFTELESGLKSKLSEELKKGIEIKPFPGVESGFRVTEKDGASYFNFTSEAVASNLAELLNPKLSGIIKESDKE
ncbi:MAG: V-type ATP synthase subunit E [Spirochaetales bacterium]|uniref:V-type ATP synthase subunit E n=1 Tax=Candidatus Thalassospirochaeta sargassi TaxID=3119039 RepID=A0AAJ1IFP2_9SPIO|nr:V-type ATP synthase subunit E [Spirochaetales bacterium]